MDQQQPAATPTDAAPEQAPKSLDERILEKFGLDEPDEQPVSDEATPASDTDGVSEEVEIPLEDVPSEPVGDFELTHNGELKKIPVNEAKRLAQMGYDYEFKMQRVQADAQRVQAMAQASQARAAIQAQALDALADAKAIERQLKQYANVDWVTEANNDPVGAFQKRLSYDQLVQAHQQAVGRVQQLQTPFAQASQAIDANWAALQEQKLLDRVPEWKDSTKRGKESQAILQRMGNDYGFTQEELSGPLMFDHRVIALMRDAAKYREAAANAKNRKGQIQGLPQTAKPGAKPQPRTHAQSVGDVKRALRQTTDRGTQKRLQDELIARKFGL